MPLTPETLTRHELAGLDVRVVDADNRSLIGIEGTVVGETMRTLRVATSTSRAKMVPKAGATFEFAITDEAAVGRKAPGSTSKPTEGDGVVYVTVDGTTLLSRPALRTEQSGDSKWR
jgi:ribonuclease P protein subunit POP4